MSHSVRPTVLPFSPSETLIYFGHQEYKRHTVLEEIVRLSRHLGESLIKIYVFYST